MTLLDVKGKRVINRTRAADTGLPPDIRLCRSRKWPPICRLGGQSFGWIHLCVFPRTKEGMTGCMIMTFLASHQGTGEELKVQTFVSSTNDLVICNNCLCPQLNGNEFGFMSKQKLDVRTVHTALAGCPSQWQFPPAMWTMVPTSCQFFSRFSCTVISFPWAFLAPFPAGLLGSNQSIISKLLFWLRFPL